jgi:hypothetical protein
MTHHNDETGMPKVAYCHICRTYHPIETMRQVITKTGMRWRCITTIEAARQAPDKRQAFGPQTTANKKAGA